MDKAREKIMHGLYCTVSDKILKSMSFMKEITLEVFTLDVFILVMNLEAERMFETKTKYWDDKKYCLFKETNTIVWSFLSWKTKLQII